MAEAITTNYFRKSLAAAFMLAPVKVVFGDGGHKADFTAISPDPDQTALNREQLRKEPIAKVQEDDYSVTVTGRLTKGELNGIRLSEAGVVDADGKLSAFKNFAPKVKENDEEYDINIKVKF